MNFEKIYNECNKYTEYNRRKPFIMQDIIDETYKAVSSDFENDFAHEKLYKQASEALADRYGMEWPLSPSEFAKCLDKLIAEKVEDSIKSHNHSDDEHFTFEALNAIESVAVDKVKKGLKYSTF